MSTPEERARNSAKSRKHYHKSSSDPEAVLRRREINRKAVLKRKYGITVEEYEALAATCSGLCCICGASDPGAGRRSMYVDHCHETGRLRGVLCSTCNLGLGMFRDSIDLMTAAILYLTDRETR